jgi:hypothetical protein
MQCLLKGVGSEKDNPTRIEIKMDREIPKLRFYYYITLWGCVCKKYPTFTLALKQRCKSGIFTPHKGQSILT